MQTLNDMIPGSRVSFLLQGRRVDGVITGTWFYNGYNYIDVLSDTGQDVGGRLSISATAVLELMNAECPVVPESPQCPEVPVVVDRRELTPRTQAILDGPHAAIRMVGLAQVMERELAVQTDLTNHWRAVAAGHATTEAPE